MSLFFLTLWNCAQWLTLCSGHVCLGGHARTWPFHSDRVCICACAIVRWCGVVYDEGCYITFQFFVWIHDPLAASSLSSSAVFDYRYMCHVAWLHSSTKRFSALLEQAWLHRPVLFTYMIAYVSSAGVLRCVITPEGGREAASHSGLTALIC